MLDYNCAEFHINVSNASKDIKRGYFYNLITDTLVQKKIDPSWVKSHQLSSVLLEHLNHKLSSNGLNNQSVSLLNQFMKNKSNFRTKTVIVFFTNTFDIFNTTKT